MLSRSLLDRSAPAHGRLTANDRFKARFRAYFWYGIVGAAVLHGVVFWMAPVVARWKPLLSKVEQLFLLPLPLEAAPAPPAPIAAAGFPFPALVGGSALEEIPRPPEPLDDAPPTPPMSEALLALMREGPSVTPHAVAPVLKNREEIAERLQRLFNTEGPAVDHPLRMEVWCLLDEAGVVRMTLVKESSGFVELDSAVLKTAQSMEFSPAWSRGTTVPVWIALPILFQVELPVASDSARVESAASQHAAAVPDNLR